MPNSDAMPPAAVSIFERFPGLKEQLEAYIGSLPLSDDTEANRGYLIQCLHKAQSLFGYLPEELQILVAERLGLHLSEVYGVVTFYTYFTTKPVGRYRINVCTGTACFVKGADHILGEFGRYLGLKAGETGEDLKFSLGILRCVGACSLAPVVMVNDKVYGNVTVGKVPEIIADCG